MNGIKVLYLPLNSQEVKQTGVVDAFNDFGADLKIFDFNMKQVSGMSVPEIRAELIKTAAEFKPDLMHMQLQFTSTIDAKTLKIIKDKSPDTIMSNWTGDVRKDVPKIFIQTSQIVDFPLISSVGQLNMYKQATNGRNVKYWQIGYNPKLYFPKKENNFSWDACFAASNHIKAGFPGHPQRTKTVQLLHSALGNKFGLFGLGWKRYKAPYIKQTQINNYYNKSKTVISVSNFNTLFHYFSDRLLMCLASGRPTVSLSFPGWESYFTDNSDIIIANTVEEIPQKVRWLVANPEIANDIGKAGAAIAKAEHTYHSRIRELLNMVGLI